MKRSDVILGITELLRKKSQISKHDNTLLNATDLAEQILDMLEEDVCMIPPMIGKGQQPIPDDCEWEPEE